MGSGTFSRLSLIAVAVAIALAPLAAQRRPAPARPAPRTPPCVERAVPFRVGETLTYSISWSSFITAATATITVRGKRPAYGAALAYYIAAEGRPTPVVSMFYSLYYKVDSWLDACTALPLRASVFSQEQGRQQNKITTFDQARGRARFEVQAATTTARNLVVPLQTQDPLSAVFALRTMDLTSGARVRMPVSYNGSVYQVEVTVNGKETLRTGIGTLSAWRLTPVVLQNGRPADSPSGLLVWMSADARRLPLKMQVELPAGKFELTLTGGR